MTRPGDNPVYEINVGSPAPLITAFSKRYDDDFNLPGNYVAVMTCSHADEGCPVVTGASARVAITYDDPKEFDGTSLEEAKYLERVLEIGREMLYAFSLVG
jgi:arsenate reductase